MNVAVIQIAVSESNSSVDDERANGLGKLLNKCACDTQGWHYIDHCEGQVIFETAHLAQWIQESRRSWGAYDVIMLLPKHRFLKDVAACVTQIRGLLQSGDKLLAGSR